MARPADRRAAAGTSPRPASLKKFKREFLALPPSVQFLHHLGATDVHPPPTSAGRYVPKMYNCTDRRRCARYLKTSSVGGYAPVQVF